MLSLDARNGRLAFIVLHPTLVNLSLGLMLCCNCCFDPRLVLFENSIGFVEPVLKNTSLININ